MITSPHDARAAVGKLIGEAAEDEFWQNALLATSEVVTHSLTYSSGASRLAAWYAPATGWLRIEVTDNGDEMPTVDPSSAHPEVGEHRLSVLLEVPAAWGIEQTPFGRVVWFEVQRKDPEMSGRPASPDSSRR